MINCYIINIINCFIINKNISVFFLYFCLFMLFCSIKNWNVKRNKTA